MFVAKKTNHKGQANDISSRYYLPTRICVFSHVTPHVTKENRYMRGRELLIGIVSIGPEATKHVTPGVSLVLHKLSFRT
jgi:hypothetical protein